MRNKTGEGCSPPRDVANPAVPVWLAIPMTAVITFICSAVTTKIISLIPGSKWIVGC